MKLLDESPVTELTLPRGAVQSWHLNPDEVAEVLITAGQCWITLEGDGEDYALDGGESMYLRGPGLLVAQGLAKDNALTVSR